MTDEELDFLKGIIKQLQDFVEEREKPYYLIVNFKNEKHKIDRYGKVYRYDDYFYCVNDNVNGGNKILFFHTKEEAEKYGDSIIDDNLFQYFVLNRYEEIPGNCFTYPSGVNID